MQLPLGTIDLIALAYFFLLWIGYARYAKHRAKKNQQASLSRSLRNHREAWALRLLKRDMRMTDASLLANQERVVGFFASTTLLLMAAIFTALTTSEQIAELTSHIPFTQRQSTGQIEAKLALVVTSEARQQEVQALVDEAQLYAQISPVRNVASILSLHSW
jgi:uncharacterized membrane protein